MAVIYFDNNATTRVDPRVVEAMLPFFTEHFGNASSRTHSFGKYASDAVDRSRDTIATWLGCVKEELTFTAGSTEAINLALQGIAKRYRSKGNRIITIATEHQAVLDTCKHLSEVGFEVLTVGVDRNGLVDMKAMEAAVNDQTILVCAMLVNNETGVVQPVSEIADIAHRHKALLFCDATQAPGKHKFNLQTLNADVLCLSAHKFYGPKGVGLLYAKRKNPRVSLEPIVFGGGHERGLRSGTLNVPGIVGMAKALELVSDASDEIEPLKTLRDKLENTLVQTGLVEVNGDKTNRAANVSNLRFAGYDAEDLMLALVNTVAVSSGSACSSETPEPSHVLTAMGLSDYEAKSSLRFSLGRFNTEQEVDTVLGSIKNHLGLNEPKTSV
ncbi:MAG TPA: cysteine desulfurase family protein [Chitinophagales bacterium]|nr:cysteine desulfurase family protein [Chitinophagales bacterium]